MLTMRALLVVLASCGLATAHLQLSSPYPVRSPLDPQTPEGQKDYSYTAPLFADGSNFPGKGYATTAAVRDGWVTGTLTAGSTFRVKIQGTAVHGGGSGQFAISYDGGNTFLVLASYIGGFPLQLDYTFNVPSALPAASKALLSWSWFNKVGNREMYQNLAIVRVVNPSSSTWSAPTIFRANTFSDSRCVTTEGDEIVFPNPGPQVTYGGMWANQRPQAPTVLAGCPYNQNQMATVSGDGTVVSSGFASSSAPASTSSSTPASSSTTASSSPSSAASSPASSSVATVAPSSAPSSSPSSSAPLPSSTVGSAACTEGQMLCTGNGYTFSICSGGAWVNYGAVAAGTKCVDGAIGHDVPAARASSSAAPAVAPSQAATVDCTPGVTISCGSNGKTWSLCSGPNNAYTNMGSVAAGTVCRNGAIVAARRLGRRHNASRPHGRRLADSGKAF